MADLAAKISDSELEVLCALWEMDRPLSLAEIRGALEPTHSWDGSTIKTLVRRLCEKGAVEAEKRSVYYYRALISRKEYSSWSTRNLIDRLFRGSAQQLVASLVQGEQLSGQDVRELMDLLEKRADHE